jgi:hypothetical protein
MRPFLLAAGVVVAAVVVWVWLASPSERLSPTGEASCSNVVIDWVEVFQVEGVRYYISPENRDVTPALGPELGRVQYNVRENVCDPFYRLKDGDATFLREGTPIYKVDDYDPKQVLATADRIYEARPEGGSVGADQLPFRDRVERIAILSNIDGKTELGAIEDARLVEAIVDAALAAPVQGETGGDWDYFLEFHLSDGLRFRRTYNATTGNMREGVRLPEPAQEIIRQALR